MAADEGEGLAGAGEAPKRTFEAPGPPDRNLLMRKVALYDSTTAGWREMPRSEREAFSRSRYRGRRRSLASRIMASGTRTTR